MNLAATARSAAIGSMLVLGACAGARESGRDIVWDSERVAPSATAQKSAGVAPGLDADGCREYTQTVRIGGEEHQAYGRACLQPDGSWQLNPPAPAASAPARSADAVPAYPYPQRYYAPPVFFGSAFIFSHRHVRHRHHHHGHRHFRRHHRR